LSTFWLVAALAAAIQITELALLALVVVAARLFPAPQVWRLACTPQCQALRAQATRTVGMRHSTA
jgi:hypothetical protein